MFKNMNREEHFSRAKGPAPSSAGGHVAASLRHDAQESPWISMLALVSRPALSLLHRVLPGRARAPALPDGGVSGWPSGESAFLGQLHDVMPAAAQHPAQHLAFLHCQHGDSWLTAESLAELGIQNADELSAKQRTSVGYFATARSFLSQVVMNAPLAQESRHEDAGHVLGGRVWSAAAVCSPVKSGGGNGNWWGGFWGAEDHSPSWLSNLSRGKEATGPPPQQHSGGHCVSSESGTKAAAVAMPTALFARCRDTGSVPGESAGPSPCPHKEDNDGLQTARTESLSSSSLRGLPLEHRLEHRLEHSLGSAGAAASCSGEVAVLTPDLDNGYSSLEEEHATCRPTPAVTDAPCEDPGSPTETTEEDGALASVCGSGTREESGEQRGGDEEEEEEESGAAGDMDREEEEAQDSDVSDSEDEEEEEEEEETAEEETPSAATPVCQNKAIAYIMGSPCSDDSDSQSDDPLGEDDDDGFDSEGSSDLSDSDDDSDCDEDTDESDSEEAAADDEAERLWSSLCRSTDPYSPRNFTASLHSAAPRPVPSSTAYSPPSSSSPNDQPPSPLLSSSPPASSPPSAESWDESSASEADDAESQRLWNAFSAAADPYSPLNFQGPLRTRAPACPGGGAGGRVRGRKGRVHPPPPPPPPPPRSRRHGTPPSSAPPSSSSPSSSSPPASSSPPGPSPEAEERLDSGFSEGLAVAVATTTVTIIAAAATGYGPPHGFTVKKVSFCEQVEEFYASGGEEEEDRRGPWEELARDRFRFRRRVQETEESIGYVLAPAFRSLAYQRLQLLLRPPHHHHHHHHS